MKLEDYKAWLLEHGEIKEEYERPYNAIHLSTKMAVTF